jgi:hypothetical protein
MRYVDAQRFCKRFEFHEITARPATHVGRPFSAQHGLDLVRPLRPMYPVDVIRNVIIPTAATNA